MAPTWLGRVRRQVTEAVYAHAMWRSAANSGLLSESERLTVVVTEMLRLSAHADDAAERAAMKILIVLLDEPDLTPDDRRIITAVLSASAGQ